MELSEIYGNFACFKSLVDHCSLKHQELKHVTCHCYHVSKQRRPFTHQKIKLTTRLRTFGAAPTLQREVYY